MKIDIIGQANLKQPMAQFKELDATVASFEARLAGLNAQLEAVSLTPKGGNATQFKNLQADMHEITRTYNAAMAASDAYTVSQVRLNDVTEENTRLLAKQKLGFSQVFGRKDSQAYRNMQNIYKEQLAMRQMIIRTTQGGIGTGKLQASLSIPKSIPASWGTLNSQVGFFAQRLSSASRVLLNWGKNTQWAGRQLTVGLTMPVAAFGAAAGAMAYQVDKEFTRVRKVYDTTANQFSSDADEQKRAQAELDAVRVAGTKTAMDAARQYGASMQDTISVQADLAATGQKGAELQAATTEVVKNAMLGEIDYQTTTKATIALQQQMHLSSTQLADTWAYMNDVENQTSLSMKDFASSIPIALGPIRQMGGDVQTLGTLMTALVSRGVLANKAANAIKALPQRLLRPSQQIQKEFMAITGQDIVKIADKNKGNIIGMLNDIYDATKNLSKLDQGKAFAGLFGSYQLTTMTNLVDSMGDLRNGVGQVSKAYEIGNQSAKQWRQVQQQEIKQVQDSVSGQFKIALATIKASLATAGEPFLALATDFLKVTTKIINFFNSLPGFVKKIALVGGVTAALAGPLIMVTGLFANFVANIGLASAWVLKLVSNFDLLGKAEAAQAMLDKAGERGIMTRTDETKMLAEQMQALSTTIYEVIAAYQKLNNMPVTVGPYANVGAPLPANPTKEEWTQLYMGESQDSRGRQRDPKGLYISDQTAKLQAEQKAEAKIAGTEAERLGTQNQLSQKAEAELQIRNKTQGAVTGMRTSTTLLGGAMAANLLIQNKTSDEISKWVMLLALGVPAVKGMGSVVGAIGVRAGEAATAFSAMVSRTAAGAKETTALAGGLNAAKAAGMGLGAGIFEMLGPLGIAAATIGVIGGAMYLWHQHEVAITKEKKAQVAALFSQNNLLEDQLGIQIKSRQQLYTPSPTDMIGGKDAVPTAQLAQDILAAPGGKDLVKSYTDAGSEVQKQTILMQKYQQVLNATGGTAAKAQKYIEAFYIASGEGALQAQVDAQNFADKMGYVLSNSKDLFKGLFESALQNPRALDDEATAIGKQLADAIATGANSQADGMLAGLESNVTSQWDDMFAKLGDGAKQHFAELGVTTAKQFQQVFDGLAQGTDPADIMKGMGLDANSNTVPKFYQAIQEAQFQFQDQIGNTQKLEKGIVQELDSQLGISKDIVTFAQLRATWEFKLQTASAGNAQQLFQQRKEQYKNIGATGQLFGVNQKLTDSQKLQILNQIRLAMGLTATTNLADRFKKNVDDSADGLGKAKDKANELATAMGQIGTGDIAGILKSAMSDMENSLAQGAQDAFETRMNNALDAAQAGWDAREKALDNKQQNQQDAFEKRWDRRKKQMDKYYTDQENKVDKEIKSEQAADDIRQQIFEAEKERIDRLNKLSNDNISFNMDIRTGKLDEAAQLQNDMIAQAHQWALADAQSAGDAQTKAREDALNDQKDALEKQRQHEQDIMNRQEDDQKRHLDRIQAQQKDALKAQEDANMKSLKAQWDAEKKNLDARLDLFKSYIALNSTDLQRWMKEVGLSYDTFGDALQQKGDSWSGAIEKSLRDHIKDASRTVANDNFWANDAATEMNQVLKGMGFGDIKGFKHFIKTGQLPDDFGKSNSPGRRPGDPRPTNTGMGPQISHGGGWIGNGHNDRSGVPRTTQGLHRSEQMVLAQKGEFMLNKDAASKYGDIAESMNRGEYAKGSATRDEYAKGGATGPFGLMAAVAMKGLVAGVGKAISNVVSQKMSASGATGSYTSAGVSAIQGYALNSAQLTNAATIANVGATMGFKGNTEKAIEIALATALVESNLTNVNYGDRDSLGLFQQRASWGTAEQRMDPKWAATQFFNHLKNVRGWATMDPGAAAQAVQISAYPDRYDEKWDEAVAIFTQGLRQQTNGPGGYLPGTGGNHKPIDSPITRGLHDTNTSFPGVDAAAPIGTKVYAVGDGRITTSEDITGNEPRRKIRNVTGPSVQDGYRSYGRMIVLSLLNGDSVLYGHLSQRLATAGQAVKGGSVIGLSGNTGNVQSDVGDGAHLHFGDHQGNPAKFWGFKGGGFTTKDTPAVVHKNEMVIDKSRTKKMYGLVDNFTDMNSIWTWMTGLPRLGPNGFPDTSSMTEDLKDVAGASDKATKHAKKDSNVAIGEYNVKFSTSNDETKEDLGRLMGLADVWSLTEYTKAKHDLDPWIKQHGWGIAGNTDDAQDSAIIWKTDKFGFKGSGRQLLNAKGGRAESGAIGKGGARPMYAEYAHLVDKDTGKSFWQVAAHTIAHIWKDPNLNRSVQQTQFGALGTLATRLGRNKEPVFIGGDLNNDPRDIAGSRPGGRQGMSNFAPLTAAGLKDNWTPQWMNKAIPTEADRYIDHIFYNIAAQLTDTKTVGGLHSDHNAVISDFYIPQLETGGLIKWDNTLANLHHDERVLTADNTSKLDRGLDNLANGGSSTYNTYVTVNGTDATAEEIAAAVDRVHRRQDRRKPTRMTNRGLVNA